MCSQARLLRKYCHSLFIEKLPKHPEYSKASPVEKNKIKKLLKQALPRAMELKDKLKELYEKEKEDLERTIQLEVREGGGGGRGKVCGRKLLEESIHFTFNCAILF